MGNDTGDGRPSAGAPDPMPLERARRRVGRAVRGRWHRASSGRRLVGLFTGLVVATALVAGVGTGSQPVYPDWPDGATLLGDLRQAPTREAWSTDLAALNDTPLPAGCRGFRPVGEIDGDALVAGSATAYDGCDSPPAMLLRIDPDSGDVRWVLDLTSRLGASGAYLNLVADDDGSLATVFGQAAPGDRAVRVDLDDGSVVADVIGPVDDPTAAVPVLMGIHSGRALVALQPRDRVSDDGQGIEYTDGDTTLYRLIDVDDPAATIWSGEVGTSDVPLLLGAFLIVETTNGPVIIDAETGEANPVPGGAATVESGGVAGLVAGDAGDAGDGAIGGAGDELLIATVTTRAGEREVMALDRSGGSRWSEPLALSGAVTVTDDCVMVSEPPSTFRCLDAVDGGERWQRTLALDDGYSARVDSYQQPQGGSAIVVDMSSGAAGVADLEDDHPSTFVGLSTATGATMFSAEVPAMSFSAGLARTAGFAGSIVGQDFSQTMVTAFDLSDGRRLWQQRSPSRGSLDFWAGALVSVDADGVAHGLRTQADVVPPTADAATSPLG